MRRGLPGSDAWLSPPDPKVPPSGQTCVYVEREVGDECVEIEVDVWFDEGSVWKSKVNGVDFELTPAETQRAEEDWAMRDAEEPDEPEWDRDRQ